jgi:signal transduction histidine kinase
MDKLQIAELEKELSKWGPWSSLATFERENFNTLTEVIATAKEVERLKAERDELVSVLAYYANGKDIYTGEHLGDYAAEAIAKVQK